MNIGFLRFKLIRWLAGDAQVMLNMRIVNGGVQVDGSKPLIVYNNIIIHK